MCGITGLAGAVAVAPPERVRALVAELNATLVHRGPDAVGAWVAPEAPLALGHRRLSIIDLSHGADQPMVDAGGDAVSFNGEIYNYASLRTLLDEPPGGWRTHGDTEVLLAACRQWGPVEALRRTRGMFALAWYDSREQVLWLGRDRFGEKPLYYAVWDGSLAFGSELKALRAVPGFPAEVDLVSVDSFMRKGVVGGERSIYRAARKVPPGALVRVALGDRITESSISTVEFWDLLDEAAKAAASPFAGSVDDAADALDEALFHSTRLASVGDVPVGAFLSGGVDSSILVAQLAGQVTQPLRTFAVGFGGGLPTEAPAARRIAEHLGTRHAEVVIGAEDALPVLPQLANMYDEPFADSSQLPTHLVSRFARDHVTVALVGDGGDELFGGYPRYGLVDRIWHRVERLPRPLRTAGVAVLSWPEVQTWDRVGHVLGVGPLRRLSGGLGERAQKAASLLGAASVDEAYRLFVTAYWERSALSVASLHEIATLPPAPTPMERMMLADVRSYLPDDLLTKVDRAAMAVSLETRVPFLDPDVFRLACSLPVEHKTDGRDGKVVVKRLLARRLPRHLWDRPKVGFGIPIGSWLRGPLRPWAEERLSPHALARNGLLDADLIARHWEEHQSGRRDWGSRLWNAAVFQAWSDRWMP